MPSPGRSATSVRRLEAQAARLRVVHERLREHVRPRAGRATRPAAAAPRRRGRPARRRARRGTPSVSVPVLSSSTVRAPAEPLDRRAALDDHAARAPRARGPRRARSAPPGSAGRASRRRAPRARGPDRRWRPRRRPPGASVTGGTRRRSGRPCARTARGRRCGVATSRTSAAYALSAAARVARSSNGLAGVGACRCARGAPAARVTGSDSPVSADSSTTASPAATMPSTGTTSPGADERRRRRARAVDRDLLEQPVAAAVRDPRRALEQRRQLAPRAAARRLLERVAAGEHQRDDRAGELLAERQRARHGQQRDHVDADVAPRAASARRRPGQHGERDGDARGPRRVARRATPRGRARPRRRRAPPRRGRAGDGGAPRPPALSPVEAPGRRAPSGSPPRGARAPRRPRRPRPRGGPRARGAPRR